MMCSKPLESACHLSQEKTPNKHFKMSSVYSCWVSQPLPAVVVIISHIKLLGTNLHPPAKPSTIRDPQPATIVVSCFWGLIHVDSISSSEPTYSFAFDSLLLLASDSGLGLCIHIRAVQHETHETLIDFHHGRNSRLQNLMFFFGWPHPTHLKEHQPGRELTSPAGKNSICVSPNLPVGDGPMETAEGLAQWLSQLSLDSSMFHTWGRCCQVGVDKLQSGELFITKFLSLAKLYLKDISFPLACNKD